MRVKKKNVCTTLTVNTLRSGKQHFEFVTVQAGESVKDEEGSTCLCLFVSLFTGNLGAKRTHVIT